MVSQVSTELTLKLDYHKTFLSFLLLQKIILFLPWEVRHFAVLLFLSKKLIILEEKHG